MLFHPDARKGFLEHMRNMTWQVLVLTLSVAMFHTIPKEQSCAYQLTYVLVALLFVAVWTYSILASGMTFIETSLKNVEAAENELKALRSEDMRASERVKATLSLLCAHWRKIWLECVFAVLAVAISGIISLVIGVAYGTKIVADLSAALA